MPYGSQNCLVAALGGALLFVTPSLAQTCRQEWKLEEQVRIGSLDGSDALNEVRSLGVAPNGEIYITQFLRGDITVFSPEGDLLRTLGRSGQGPGEFERAPSRVTWHGGALWVSDQFRLQSFDAEGRPDAFIRFQVPFPEESARYTPDLPLADGTLWGNRWLVPTLGRRPFGAGTEAISFRRFSSTGEVLGTIATVDVRGRYVQVSDRPSYQEHPLWAWLPGSFHDDAQLNLSEDRSSMVLPSRFDVEGDATSFEVFKVDLHGDTIVRWSVPYAPVEVTPADRDWLRGQFAAYHAGDFFEGLTGYRQPNPATKEKEREFVAEHFWMPDFYPPAREIIAGADGTVFVLRELRLPTRADRWEVFGPRGAFLGQFTVTEGRSSRLPWSPRMRILRASRDEIWATTVDEYDVPYVHRFIVTDSCGENGST